MERLSDSAVRDLFARMRLRIEELERECAGLRAENQRLQRPRDPRGVHNDLVYRTEAARLEARRRSWRESKRRAKLREAA